MADQKPYLIALLSDTHDHAANLRTALTLLAPHNPQLYLHLGDLCSPDMLRLVAHLPKNSFHFVFGNNDYDHPALRSTAAALGLICHGHAGQISAAGKTLALTHGDDARLLQKILTGRPPDYLFHGHTHKLSDTHHAHTRIINPGALYRATPKTVALLDLTSDKLQILQLPNSTPTTAQ